MCLRHVGEDAVMIMALVSLFSAGKPFSGNIPSRIKIQPPDAGPTGSPGSGPFPLSLDSFSNLLLPPHPQTHTHIHTPNDHLLPKLLFHCSVLRGSFRLESPPPPHYIQSNVSTLNILFQESFLHAACLLSPPHVELKCFSFLFCFFVCLFVCLFLSF